MRALLDEQLSPQIAVLLRDAGYDVLAVADRESEPSLVPTRKESPAANGGSAH